MRIIEQITRSPALALEPHDWYAETFLKPGRVQRPVGDLRVFLTRKTPDPKWRFRGEAELITVSSPSGFVAFYDRARGLLPSVSGETGIPGPESRTELPAGDYEGRVLRPGFQEARFKLTVPVVIPIAIELLPGPTYPFPTGRRANGLTGPTLLRGTVVTAEGLGAPGVQVDILERPLVRPCVTDTAGGWVLVLDLYNPDFPSAPVPANAGNDLITPPLAGPVDVRFGLRAGTVTVTGVGFELGRETSLPLTSIRGTVHNSDGRPIGGATVRVNSEVVRTEPSGSWVYFFPLTTQRTGVARVTVTIVAPNGRSASADVDLRYGELTRVPPVIV